MRERLRISDTLIVLGRGNAPDPEDPTNTLPCEGSALNALAAGLLYYQGGIKQIIICGGPTLGVPYPSEAKSASDYLFAMFPDIPASAVTLESGSIDTAENITNLLQMGLIKRGTTVQVLSVGLQLQRTILLFDELVDIDAETISSEFVVGQSREAAHRAVLAAYYLRLGFVWELIKEPLLLVWACLIDPDGMVLRKITIRMRHDSA
jgi:hypothetical protein